MTEVADTHVEDDCLKRLKGRNRTALMDDESADIAPSMAFESGCVNESARASSSRSSVQASGA